ncbi:MAG: YhjD/YihY/BrkB family envelope integrity protein [Phycisphaerae bacterium]|nr:YhjD/YihY/BrkB family envelope integrity protein [Phycisphaerae bacterium]
MTASSSNRQSRQLSHERYRQLVRRTHGADGWLLEWLAPLRHMSIGRFSMGELAEIATFCIRHLREDRAPQIAATLAFRTLFGLVPVLVVVTLAAKAMLGNEFASTMSSLFDSVGLSNVQMPVTTTGDEADAQLPPFGVAASVGLDDWLGKLVDHAANQSVTALGWTGFVLVLMSAIWVLITIEEAFNTIFRCEYGRGWVRRLLVYWFLLTVAPLVLSLAPLLLNWVAAMTASVDSWAWLAALGRLMLSLAIFWAAMWVAYVTIPATRVAWRPAVIGALVSAVLLEIGKRSLGLYLQNAFSMSVLYGSLGAIPLFMFWVYLMWLAILFGAEVAALLQAIRRRERDAPTLQVADSESFIRSMSVISHRFRNGETTSFAELSGASRLPPLSTMALIDRLEEAGFVRRIDGTDELTLAKPADLILVTDVFKLAWGSVDRLGDGPGAVPDDVAGAKALTQRLREMQRDALEGMTLATLAIEPTEGSAKSGQPLAL